MLREMADGIVGRSIVDDEHLSIDARQGFLHAVEALCHKPADIITDYDY
jgi:hypothetical protein